MGIRWYDHFFMCVFRVPPNNDGRNPHWHVTYWWYWCFWLLISLWNPVFHVCDSFPRARALEFHPNVPQGLRHVVKTSSSATASHPQWSSGAWLRRWTDNLRSWGSSLGEFQVVVSINFYFYLSLQWYLRGIIHPEFFCGVVSTSQRDCQYGGNPPCPQGFGFRFDDIWFTTQRSTF